LKIPIYSSTNSPFYALQHQKPTAKQQRISTAKTAKKENLQQRKLQHLKIYRSTNSTFYAPQHQKTTAKQQRISTVKQRRKNLQQRNLQHLKIYRSTYSPFYATTASKIYSNISREFLQPKQRRKRIYNRENYSFRKSTAKSAENFYSKTAKKIEFTASTIYSKISTRILQQENQPFYSTLRITSCPHKGEENKRTIQSL